jgi:hypothetical protein
MQSLQQYYALPREKLVKTDSAMAATIDDKSSAAEIR